jgi:hypothetical protein
LTKQTKLKRLLNLTPVLGTILFATLYVVATFYYPGGNQQDINSDGFSWRNNYWCNLLNDEAVNGSSNTAQPIALIAMFILCLIFIYFWITFPKYADLNKQYKRTIQASGILAMTIGFFLSTRFDHDAITSLASLFGLIALTGTLIGLNKNRWKVLFYFGILNILFFTANIYLYFHKDYITYLPVVQKITFATFLIWICSIEIKIYTQFTPVFKQKTNSKIK